MGELSTGLRTLGTRFDIEEGDVAVWSAILLVEFLAVLAYVSMTSTTITEPRYAVYPFIWINVGLLAVSRTKVSKRSRGIQTLALGVTGLYLLVLLYLGGLVRFGIFTPLGSGTEFRISWALLGWGPVVVFRNPWLQTVVVPFKAAGYLSFAYLLYARLLDATKGVLSGVFGLVSCVGCTFSILMPLFGASAFSAVTQLSWDLSTVVFLITVALLYWSAEIEAILSAYTRSLTS
ncbi:MULTISPECIES: hypothetical protein [unclassified Haloferax]|jgi:hypothetical protein|uniref:DUF7546 family protein n=1 Tax=unclassified Haloferax TaxID=2625095 RepID=UPI0028766AAB|nr:MULTISPECIES: hypothetical protein [unclassified Haloferax]MDS0243776.1 hypothetical protein [Haloferax sp. S2CR25]MDS0446897.1 hypothetical protein [Haloferax sp. S2CR25-2]